MYTFKKYEFDSKSQADTRIESITDKEHSIVRLGYLYSTLPVEDEEGNVITEGVRSTKYSVDVLWKNSLLQENGSIVYPYGWKSKEITLSDNGVHTFAGYNFNE